MYRQLIFGQSVPDQPLSSAHNTLKLSGVVGFQDGTLKIRNKVYQQVFDRTWVEEHLHRDRTVLKAVASSAAIALFALAFWYWYVLPQEYITLLSAISSDARVVETTHKKLSQIVGYGGRADSLLARFWDRSVAKQENQDGRFLASAKAQGSKPSLLRTRRMGRETVSSWGHLMMTFRHAGGVNVIALSADGTKVVTGSDDNTARVWDANSGEALTPALSHKGPVRSVALSADGTKVVTRSFDNTARVWDANTGEALGSPIEVGDSIYTLAFSEDGRSLHVATDWWVTTFRANEEAGDDWLETASVIAEQLLDHDGNQ